MKKQFLSVLAFSAILLSSCGGTAKIEKASACGQKGEITASSTVAVAETESGKSIAHYDLRFLKPLDEGLLHEVGRKFRHIVTIEDGVIQGGMGSAVLEFMADHEYTPTEKRIGIPDKFVQHGTIAQLYQLCGMDEDSITKELLKQCALQLSMSGVKELTN